MEEVRAYSLRGLDPRAGRQWTSMEVYGSVWMAPRAGFEVDLKFLSAQGTVIALRRPEYPQAVPHAQRAAWRMRKRLGGRARALQSLDYKARDRSQWRTRAGFREMVTSAAGSGIGWQSFCGFTGAYVLSSRQGYWSPC